MSIAHESLDALKHLERLAYQLLLKLALLSCFNIGQLQGREGVIHAMIRANSHQLGQRRGNQLFRPEQHASLESFLAKHLALRIIVRRPEGQGKESICSTRESRLQATAHRNPGNKKI